MEQDIWTVWRGPEDWFVNHCSYLFGIDMIFVVPAVKLCFPISV